MICLYKSTPTYSVYLILYFKLKHNSFFLGSENFPLYQVPHESTSRFFLCTDLQPLSIASLDPTPLIPNHKLAVPEKGTVEIFCDRPKGLPVPKLWWEGPEGKVILDTTSTSSTGASTSNMFPEARTREPNTLVVPNVRGDKTGTFACVAENVAGISRMSFQLVVVASK